MRFFAQEKQHRPENRFGQYVRLQPTTTIFVCLLAFHLIPCCRLLFRRAEAYSRADLRATGRGVLYTKMAKRDRNQSRSAGVPAWAWPVSLALLIVVFFWRAFLTDQILMAQDSSLAGFAEAKAAWPFGSTYYWSTHYWLGSPAAAAADTPGFQLLRLLSAEAFARLIFPLHVLALTLFGFYWLRRMELNEFGAFFGALVMALAGSNLSYILPGHISKFEMTTLATLALWCVTRALQTARWPSFAWAGVALGLTVSAATDVGAFMALLLAAWVVFYVGSHWFKANETLRRQWAMGFTLLVALAGLTALPTLGGLARLGLATTMPGNEQGEGEMQRWHWATQWSYPPNEVIGLFVPGYHGWKTHDVEAPYWGALGRNPQFDASLTPADVVKTVVLQGNPQNEQLRSAPAVGVMKAAMSNNAGQLSQLLMFWNFRLNSDFSGSVTLLAILLALVAVFVPHEADTGSKTADWREQWRHRFVPVVLFWLAVAVVGLLISFGRHFPPPFRLLHSLPLFSSMRNPNKALVIVTPALAVLAAIGMDRLWRETEKRGA